jgi:hypothetical protein
MLSIRPLYLCLLLGLLLAVTGTRRDAAAQPGPDAGDTRPAAPVGADPAPPPEPADPGETMSNSPGKSDLQAEIDRLRQEYLKLRDELFASRARAAAVASQLFSSKLSLRLEFASARTFAVSRASIRLDGASVFDDSDGIIASNHAVRFEGYVAPGRHVVTYRVEAQGRDDDRFTSAVETTVVVQVTAGKDVVAIARARDDGDISYQWKKGEAGSYRLGLDVDVKSIKRPLAAGTTARPAGASTANAN